MDITLYHSPGACSDATLVSLLEAGADFEVKLILLKNNEQSNPDYIALNPKQKVPFLVVDGKGLSENIAMQTWIAETFPDANLLPSDSWDHKRALSYMSWFGAGIHPHITRHYKPVKFTANEDAHGDIKAKAKEQCMEQLALVDRELAGKTWFFDHYTTCDSYFFWIYERTQREGFDLNHFEHCTAHNKRMNERVSVQKLVTYAAV